MMTREIFVGLSSSEGFDIDGVLNSEKFFRSGAKTKDKYFDSECIARLNSLKDLNVEIVISSSWGEDGGKTEERLKEAGLKLPIIGYTKHFYQNYLCRGNEIEQWLYETFGGMCTKYGKEFRDCHEKGYEFVIFDDNSDFLLGQQENFIHVNSEIGLSNADISKARSILEKVMDPQDLEVLENEVCMRLRYWPYIEIKEDEYGMKTIAYVVEADTGEGTFDVMIPQDKEFGQETVKLGDFKLCLRPLSDMSKEEMEKMKQDLCPNGTGWFEEDYFIVPMSHFGDKLSFAFISEITEWLLKHHFDINGLIEKGLAVAVTKDFFGNV